MRQHGAVGDAWHSWYDVSGSSGEPMLLTFAGGPRGRQVEAMTDEQVVASALAS
ncbi:hypothetical protein P3H80_05530 [Mycolicibacterium septicum]|uniref:hypothetical protein n=1 Tax=Mycolicibacterium septicum TaxID=98668 RepID=UPI0023E2D4FE|nr:hypothetical protein [Mycolicibacterium septicum]MDF3336869.1 hypothetical protein [Mycolicibacterium septicum]